MRKFRAVIFDMDGVLVDSEPLYFKAINRVLEEEKVVPITEQENLDHLLGTTVEETWRRIANLRNLLLPLAYYRDKYDPSVRQVLKDEMTPQPGVARLLEELGRRHLKSAVASSSLGSWLSLKLDLLGLRESFDVVLGGDDVDQGKPEPDIYLLAARRLRLPPENCVAIEDSPVGIAAAVASGSYTIAVRTDSTRGLDISQAHMILDSLEQFDLAMLADH